MVPLISAIMPTRNRRKFIPQAIECFARQTWPNKQLVVVDNGEDAVRDLVPPWAIYLHVGTERKTTGWMRNTAVAISHGDYICHFDDDDASHPERMREQYDLLIRHMAAFVGYRSMYFIEEEKRLAWMYYGDPDYAIGTSFFYRRSYWKAHKFPEINIGEDNEFVKAAKGKQVVVDAGDRMVARIHSGNTSVKENLEILSSWHPVDYQRVATICGCSGLSLASSSVACSSEVEE